jgi:hypothetical protein
MEEKIEIKSDSTDIVEHLQTLVDISKKCDHITEMGVRGVVSTWAFAVGVKKGGKLVSIDIAQSPQEELDRVADFSKRRGIDFEFKLADTLQIDIDETDLLFIDTLHTGEQLEKELNLHAPKARKFIIFHDTESCKNELWPVIDKFLKDSKEWALKTVYTNNNGLTIIRRL